MDLSVGVGIGLVGCSVDRMPGWDRNTWGLHGDEDGGVFHGHGYSLKRQYEWRYSAGDVIGVCVDSQAGTAFFTKNGELLGEYEVARASYPILCWFPVLLLKKLKHLFRLRIRRYAWPSFSYGGCCLRVRRGDRGQLRSESRHNSLQISRLAK